MTKRAALARALIHNPNILYLDEPTTGLDPTRTGSIHDLIRRTQEKFGLTVVMVSHDLQAISELCDRVILLDHGRIRQIGPAAQVIASYEQQAHAAEQQAA